MNVLKSRTIAGFRALILPAWPWTPAYKKAVAGTAALLLILYGYLASGADFFGCYTWMVTGARPLSSVATLPWTFNPPWQNFFMAPFVTLPGRSGYLLFLAATVAMVVLGVRFFHGNALLTLVSSQMFWVMWWGQLEGWGVLGLVLAWKAVEAQSWVLMFASLALSSFKPQVGLIPVLFLWWISGRARWKAMAAFVGLFLLSLLIWGPWPVWYLQGIFTFVGDKHFVSWNASLGLMAAPLFIPALLIPMDRRKRLIAITATALLFSPYMPYYSTILLLCLEIPWWVYPLVFLGYFPVQLGTALAWNGIVAIPILVLGWLYLPMVKNWWQKRGKKLAAPTAGGLE